MYDCNILNFSFIIPPKINGARSAKRGVSEITADNIVTTKVAKNPSHLNNRKNNDDKTLVQKYGSSKRDNPQSAISVTPNGNPITVRSNIKPITGTTSTQISPEKNRENGEDKI